MNHPNTRRTLPTYLIVAAVIALAGAVAFGQNGDADPDIEKMSFLTLLGKGGYFMIPIAICSLLALAVIIERLIALRHSRVVPAGFLDGLRSVFRSRADRADALEYCYANDSPLSRIAAAGIRKMHKGDEAMEQGIEDAGANEVSKLRRNLRMLYGIGAVAPMLGLVGTVWGMIQAFQVASQMAPGSDRGEQLGVGIYEALVTTFGGLCVAIPVMIFYYYFLGKIDRLVHEMNDLSVQLVEHYAEDSDQSLPEPRPEKIKA